MISIGLKDITICFFVPLPLNLTSNCLKSLSSISEASSAHISVSSPLLKVTDFSFSTSSNPLNIISLPLSKHFILKSLSFILKQLLKRHLYITCLNNANVLSLLLLPVARTVNKFINFELSILYIYLSTIIDNNLYYLYEYSNTKSLFGTAENNTYKFGVGLFKTNLETTETQLVYDFKNVIPRGLRQYRFPDVLQIIDDDTFIFSYNGDLSVFDVKTQTIKETLKFYDKEIFKNIEYGDICFKRNGDCYYHLKDGKLRYAEFKNGHYIDHSFKVDKESSYIARFENYIYTYTYIGGFGEPYKYLNCYDLETEEEKDHEFLMEIVEKEKQREEQEKDQQKDITDKESIIVGNKIYYYTHNENQVVITDEKGDTIYEINSKYASLNNSKFVKLFGVYFNYTDVAYADVSEVKIFDNRMFISFTHNIMMWGSTPQMIFEFDIESGNLYYLTYMSGSSFYFYNINGNPI